MRPFLLFLGAAAVLAACAGCKTLHPEPPEFPSSLLARLAPQFPPLTVSRAKGALAFSEQREAANKAVKEVLEIKPAVTFSKEKPVTLAIAEVGPDGIETIRKDDKEAWRTALEASGLVRVVFISSVILSGNPQFHEIRIAAARLHADAVLLYASASSRAYGTNVGGWLYLTVVGAFCVPGSQSAVLTFAKGVCFDVENEYLEFAVEGEDERSSTLPWFFLNTDALELESRKAAVEVLRKETLRAIEGRAKHGK
ncbi:MAG: hypothetical protein ACYS47_08860 [Planctomycetota bacterium]|jgi:hypothetical protein